MTSGTDNSEVRFTPTKLADRLNRVRMDSKSAGLWAESTTFVPAKGNTGSRETGIKGSHHADCALLALGDAVRLLAGIASAEVLSTSATSSFLYHASTVLTSFADRLGKRTAKVEQKAARRALADFETAQGVSVSGTYKTYRSHWLAGYFAGIQPMNADGSLKSPLAMLDLSKGDKVSESTDDALRRVAKILANHEPAGCTGAVRGTLDDVALFVAEALGAEGWNTVRDRLADVELARMAARQEAESIRMVSEATSAERTGATIASMLGALMMGEAKIETV